MVRSTIVVTGASGTVGGAVVKILAGTGGHDVVALLRRPPGPNGLPDGAAHRIADYRDPGALRHALTGADTLVFVSSDGEAANVVMHHRDVIAAARYAEVAHVVYLSGVDADTDSPFCYAVTNAATEGMLARAGPGFSIVRASIFAEFFDRWPRAALDTGELRLPAADGRIALVTQHDVAHALAALARDAPTGGHHNITGPEALGMSAIAARYEQTCRRPLRYVDVTPQQHRIAMVQADTDPWWAYAYTTMFASIRQQRWSLVSDDYEQLTGQPSTPFAANP